MKVEEDHRHIVGGVSPRGSEHSRPYHQIGGVIEYTSAAPAIEGAQGMCIEGAVGYGCQIRIGDLVQTGDSRNPTAVISTRSICFTPGEAGIAFQMIERVMENPVVDEARSASAHIHSRMSLKRILRREENEGDHFRFAIDPISVHGQSRKSLYQNMQVSRQELSTMRDLLLRFIGPQKPASPTV
jgi:hypothetical protein